MGRTGVDHAGMGTAAFPATKTSVIGQAASWVIQRKLRCLARTRTHFHKGSTKGLRKSDSCRAAKSGADRSNLEELIEAWPELSDAVRGAILVMVRAVSL